MVRIITCKSYNANHIYKIGWKNYGSHYNIATVVQMLVSGNPKIQVGGLNPASFPCTSHQYSSHRCN